MLKCMLELFIFFYLKYIKHSVSNLKNNKTKNRFKLNNIFNTHNIYINKTNICKNLKTNEINTGIKNKIIILLIILNSSERFSHSIALKKYIVLANFF